MTGIDAVALTFKPSGLIALNVILALIMFGVALDLRRQDFKNVFVQPKSAIVGLTGQLILLPLATFGMTLLLDLPASIELGMILVAACPGGNVSNFLTSFAKGNASLSISMTAIVTTLAIVITPIQISLLGGWNPTTAPILQQVSIDPLRMIGIVALIIGLPVLVGMTTAEKRPALAQKLRTPFTIGSLFFLGVFIVVALANNVEPAWAYIPKIAGIVVAHNALALTLGRFLGWVTQLPTADQRTVTIEVGIQNSGLGLVLIFSFFNGLGGMAIIAAFWGIWHLVSGVLVATFWSKRTSSVG